MPLKDFDAALAASENEETEPPEPVRFKIGGREWTAAWLSDRLRLKFAAAPDALSRSAVMDDMLERLVVTEESADWNEFLLEGTPATDETPAKVPPSIMDFYEIIAYVVSEQSGRPTTP